MDDLFRALSNVHRRRLLVALLDRDRQRDEINLPKDVHEGEQELEILRLQFHHSHLPRLEEAGFIRWNEDELVAGPRFEEVRPFLEVMRDNADELPADWLSAQSTYPANGRSPTTSTDQMAD